jgi:hypothetical protein
MRITDVYKTEVHSWKSRVGKTQKPMHRVPAIIGSDVDLRVPLALVDDW